MPLPAGVHHAALYGVSCSTAADCTAVGTYLHTRRRSLAALAGHWNGTAWCYRVPPSPIENPQGESLDSISCPSATVCDASPDLGEFPQQNPLAEQQ